MMTLRAARINKQLTQKEVAEKLGCTMPTIAAWENGKSKITLDNVKKLLELYEVSIEEIDWPNIGQLK